jgi:DNA-binding SARP family transcriptional activator/tetratricopeptide (TPR) repeat protein
MRFGILGPLQVGDGQAAITAGRDRTVLAMLLLRAGRVVPVDELVDAVWEDDPPATARGQLQTCVSRLRRRLSLAGLPGEAIVTDPVGYGLRVGAADLDADEFRRLADTAHTAVLADRLPAASRDFRAALALWRGPALSGITSPAVRRGAVPLDEQRAGVTEECLDIELRLGRAPDLIGELTDLVERYPLRERLRGLLMLALCAVGRQVEALTVYRDGRRITADQLGIEPGSALRELHQRVLAGSVDISALDRSAVSAGVRCLPRAIDDFTGRQESVSRLVKEIEGGGGPGVQVIDGMPGSGKTTLAVYVATALGPRYPDAHLFVDLHGHSERSPLQPVAALAILLRQLGVPGDEIPTEVEDRISRWRSELSDRRAVIVLDNAASAAQVAPLLPNGPGCLTLVTSRRRLTGLDGVRLHTLTVLDPDEAIQLLARIAGPEQVAADPAASAEVVRRCGYLPLAIRLAGARLAHRPRWRVADLAARLDAGRPALAGFTAEHRTVTDAFALSYAQLSEPAQRMFQLLGCHPGDQFDTYAAAALTELPLPVAQDLLDKLVDAHLVEEPDVSRYRFHDLVREYARGLAAATEGAAGRRAAVERLIDFNLHVASALTRPMESAASRANFVLPAPGRPDLVEECAQQGRRWFEDQRANLLALARFAADERLLRQCWQLARVSWRYWYMHGHLDELIETHTIGLRAAEALSDDWAIAAMANYLSSAYFRLGRYQDAIDLLEVALDIRKRIADLPGQASSHKNLGIAYALLGRLPTSLEHLQRALEVSRRTGQPALLADVLNDLGVIYLQWGRYDEALDVFRRQLPLSRQLGDLRQLGSAIGHIGAVLARLGRYDAALRRLRLALHFKRITGNRFGEGEVLNEFGVIERTLGNPESAVARHREALLAMVDGRDRAGECASRNLLGRALLDLGNTAAAVELHRRALADATKIESRYEQARALDGLAACVRETDRDAARSYWTRALALLEQIESPDRHDVRARLAELAEPRCLDATGGPA